MNECENFLTFVMPDICKVLDQKDKIWTDFVRHTQPMAMCPFKKGKSKVVNATILPNYLRNLSFLRQRTVTLIWKFYKPIKNIRHKKRLLFCFMAEATVKSSRTKRIGND